MTDIPFSPASTTNDDIHKRNDDIRKNNDDIRKKLRSLDAHCLDSMKCRNGEQVDFYSLRGYLLFVQWGELGYEVYVPITDDNNIENTYAALDRIATGIKRSTVEQMQLTPSHLPEA
jgi:hypothetical protein